MGRARAARCILPSELKLGYHRPHPRPHARTHGYACECSGLSGSIEEAAVKGRFHLPPQRGRSPRRE